MTERGRPVSQEELARSLLASARLDEKPVPDAVRHGMLAALGAAGALGSASVAASAASGALHRLALAKWIAATVLVGTAGVGVYKVVNQLQSSGNASRPSDGTHAAGHGEKAPEAAAATTDQRSAALQLPTSETHGDAATQAEARAQSHRNAGAASASADKVGATDASSLEGEVTALDRARSALAAGDAAGALKLLAQYEQAFPKGALRPEATYLRIQALSKSGQHDAARELAARFLAKHPSSPHAAQLQALLSR
jgi:hypothetical protein